MSRVRVAPYFFLALLAVFSYLAILSPANGQGPNWPDELTQIITEIQNKQHEKAIKGLRSLVRSNSTAAMRLMASLYLEGRIVPKDVGKAIAFIRRAADLRDFRAAYSLGKAYLSGRLLRRDEKKAVKYLAIAADQNFLDSSDLLSDLQDLIKKNADGVGNLRTPGRKNPVGAKITPRTQGQREVEITLGVSGVPANWAEASFSDRKIIGSGSAFAISGNGLFVTNHHVTERCGYITIIYQGGSKGAVILAESSKYDISVLKVDGVTPSFFVIKSSGPDLGEEIISGGFPNPNFLGSSIKITTGVVSSTEDKMGFFQHSAPTQPGNSGGALLDQTGKVAGIATAVFSKKIDGLIPQNINYGVSSRILAAFLKEMKIRWHEQSASRLMPIKILASRLEKTAGLVVCQR